MTSLTDSDLLDDFSARLSPGAHTVRVVDVGRVLVGFGEASTYIVRFDVAGSALPAATLEWRARFPDYLGPTKQLFNQFVEAAWLSRARMLRRSAKGVLGQPAARLLDHAMGRTKPLTGVYLRVTVAEDSSVSWSVPDDLTKILFDNVLTDGGRAWLRSVLPVNMREHVRPGNELVLWDWCCERGIVPLE